MIHLRKISFINQIRKIITPKYYLLALGLNNLTGQKHQVVTENKLEHCMSYDLCCEVETLLSEAVFYKSDPRVH